MTEPTRAALLGATVYAVAFGLLDLLARLVG